MVDNIGLRGTADIRTDTDIGSGICNRVDNPGGLLSDFDKVFVLNSKRINIESKYIHAFEIKINSQYFSGNEFHLDM